VVLLVGVLGGLAMLPPIALSSVWSDRFGRRRIVLGGLVVALPWSFLVMPLLDTGSAALFGIAIAVTYVILGVVNGPLAAFIPEMFATRYRYTGAGLAFNAGGIIGGAMPPMLAGALVANVGSWAVGLMMAILILISLCCTALLPETLGTALTHGDIR
jgi:MFS family permease